MVELKRCTNNDPDFRKLVNELDAELNIRNGAVQAQYAVFNRIDFIDTVVLAYDDNVPVGCGCFKAHGSRAEIKRMFVDARYRGKGIASMILGELECWAKEENFTGAILETGLNQFEAIGLYGKLGFCIVDNYEPYVGNVNSICMEKLFDVDL